MEHPQTTYSLHYTGILDPTQYSSFVEGRVPEAKHTNTLNAKDQRFAVRFAPVLMPQRFTTSNHDGAPPAIHYFKPRWSTPRPLIVKLHYTGTLDPTKYSSFVEGRVPEAKHTNTPNVKHQKEVLQGGKHKFFTKPVVFVIRACRL
ncbi:MAG: hypothetical protein M1830_001406 [Pleopsidium flavum]|nr:MAG: hypothetical protein M1830_001406 [Pleopsidium flavum]